MTRFRSAAVVVLLAAALTGCSGSPADYGITGPGTGPETTAGLARAPVAPAATGEPGSGAAASVIEPPGVPTGAFDPANPASSPTYIGNGRFFDYN